MTLPDHSADLLDLAPPEVAEVPGRLTAGDVEQKVAKNLSARFGVCHLRMKLDSETARLEVLERGDWRARRGGCRAKARRRLDDAVAVTCPNSLVFRRVREQRRFVG